jgi:hypothetical protein
VDPRQQPEKPEIPPKKTATALMTNFNALMSLLKEKKE